jgi:hypothetical protein
MPTSVQRHCEWMSKMADFQNITKSASIEKDGETIFRDTNDVQQYSYQENVYNA